MRRSRNGTIHRDACGHAGRAPHWQWADSFDSEDELLEDLIRYPWLRLCYYCFGSSRPALALARLRTRPLRQDGNRRVCGECYNFSCQHGRRAACPVTGCECTTLQRVS